jgi:hypothetical protein
MIDAIPIGYCGLGRMVDTLGLGSSVPIELDVVVSPRYESALSGGGY